MLLRRAFATNSLKQTFVWDVWFDGQNVYSNIEHLSNIDEMCNGRSGQYVKQILFNLLQLLLEDSIRSNIFQGKLCIFEAEVRDFAKNWNKTI